MSDAGITISIPTGQIEAVNRLLDGFKWMASDLSKPFKRFSVYYGATVMRTFKEKGRPPGSWKRLAPYTLAMRQWRNKRSNPEGILQDTGILRMSFTSEIQPQGMRYGTSVPYAVRHQVGGTKRLSCSRKGGRSRGRVRLDS
jgi:phage gpG-like protein